MSYTKALVPPSGPRSARIMIVGEAPGETEVSMKQPFVGQSGQELTRMLSEAGIMRQECFITNVVPIRPPGNDIEHFITKVKSHKKPGMEAHKDRWVSPEALCGLKQLWGDISTVKPNLIIALGDTALWALTGKSGIVSWRGSVLPLDSSPGEHKCKVVPTYHPAAILRMWPWRWIAVHDLRRALAESKDAKLSLPPYRFVTRPSTVEVLSFLHEMQQAAERTPLVLSLDLETRHKRIACVGLAWSHLDALCIPILCTEKPSGYFDLSNLEVIVKKLRELLTHPNVEVVGQNLIYDFQYIARWFGFLPNFKLDTMLAHHVAFLGLPKGLDFLSSLYCSFHQYWKDEGKLWDPHEMPEDQLWSYNCKDAVVTWEIAQKLPGVLASRGLQEQSDFQHSLFLPVLRMMLRGVRMDESLRSHLTQELNAAKAERLTLLEKITGQAINVNSPKQLQQYFYQRLGIKPVISRKSGNPTCDEDALIEISKREPLTQKICHAIIEARAIGVSAGVANTAADNDGRLRCSYNIAGTKTTRFSSSEDAFGSGTNLQNWTSGRKSDFTGLELPNLRRLLIPDPEHVIFDADLDRADLQVVVWEADEAELKQLLRMGVDMHCVSATIIYEIKGIPFEELVETHPNYWDHRGRIGKQKRHNTKAGVHATNYYCQPPKLASVLGITRHEAQLFQAKWFGRYPGIKRWHQRTERQLLSDRTVKNAFGYKMSFFDRVEEILPEALAWIPQSTVARIINTGLKRLDTEMPQVQLLLQVHDSLAGQYHVSLHPTILPQIRQRLLVTVPYADPLVIPVGFKVSTKSWGDCEAIALDEEYAKL